MAMDVSRLGIEVTTTGIKEASTALGGLSRSASGADGKVQSLTANLAKLMNASGNVTGSVSGLTGVMALINTALQSAATNAAAMAQALAQGAQGMNNLTQSVNQSTVSFRQNYYHGGVVITTLKAMATATAAYFSVRSARNLIDQSDAWGLMQAKLKLATGSMVEAKEVQGVLYDMSMRLRAPLEDMGKLYTRLAVPLQRMGKTSQETANMVESVSLALKLGGATAAEASSTMLQFSQAANSGRLNGAEFNSVAENGALILRALEEYLGKNTAELKKMGAEGKLTFDIISAALAAKLPQWREDFNSLPLTMEGAMQRLKNAWFKAVGEIGQDSKLGVELAKSIGALEEYIPRFVSSLIGGFNFVIENGKILTTVFTGLLGLTAAKWALEAAVAFKDLATAIGLVGIASKATGGWIGLLVGLLSAGATAWALWGGEGKKSSEQLTTQASTDTESRIRTLQREIDKLNERNRVAAGGTNVGGTTAADQTSAAAQASLQTLIKLRAQLADPSVADGTKAALKIAIDQKQAEFERLMAYEQSYTILRKQTEEMDKQKKISELIKDATKKFGDKDERANLAVEDWKERFKAIGADLPKDLEAKIREKYTKEEAKSETEAQRVIKAANAERDKTVKLYNEMNAAYADMQKSQSAEDKRTQSEKELLYVTNLLNKARKEGAPDDAIKALTEAKNFAAKTVEVEKSKDALQAGLKAQEDFTKSQESAIQAAQKEAVALEDKVAAFGKVKGSIEETALAQAKMELADMSWSGATDAQVQAQIRLVDALQRVADAKAKLGQLDLSHDIDKWFDDKKAADFANGFASAFGKVGQSIDKAGKALDQYKKKMVDNAKERKRIEQEIDPVKRHLDEDRLRSKELRDTIDMYADMAGAVKGFFKEKTFAYKAFDAIEKGLRITQMALAWQEMAVKIAATEGVTAAKATATTEGVALDATSTTSAIAAGAAQTAAWLSAGVAKAFAVLGPFGFAAAAAMVAFVASLGFGGGGGAGGGSAPLFEERQKKQGTGTVLGDENAKSESISKALERMRDNSNVGLTYTAEMLAALRSIDTKMGGLTSSIARVQGMTTGTNFGIQTGTNTDGGFFGIGGLFGSTITRSIQDTGLMFTGLLKDFLSGSGSVKQYVDVQEVENDSGFFGIGGGTSTSTWRELKNVAPQLTSYVSSIFKDITDTVVTASDTLGLGTAEIRDKLKNFEVDVQVSLMNLKGSDLTDALKAIFSAAADEMAAYASPQFMQFQRAGEGYFDTLTRVATSSERAKDALSKLGVSMVFLQELTDKTADVDTELVRESLMRAESGTSLEHILKLLDGSMSDLVESYNELTRVRNQMQATGLGSNLSLALIRGAGGVSELSKAFDTYIGGFYTAQEKAQIGLSHLTMEFGRLNLAVPASKDAFKALVASLMAGGEQQQELAGRVLALAGEWSDAVDEVNSAREELVGKARDALQNAYDKEAETLTNLADKMKDFSESLKSFRDSLIMGDKSTKNPLEKYQTALANYNDISAKAFAGDETAIGQFQKAAEDLLSYSRQVNASGAAYTADFDRVLQETQALQQFTEAQADVATQSLELLKQQVSGLLDVNDSVKSVAQAITDLQNAMAALLLPGEAATSPVSSQVTYDPNSLMGKILNGTATSADIAQAALSGVIDGSHADGLDSVPYDGYVAELHKGERVLTATQSKDYALTGARSQEALCAELQALREEVRQLKEEQREQTSALITSNYDANERNAQAVVAGQKDAAADAAYASRTPIGLN